MANNSTLLIPELDLATALEHVATTGLRASSPGPVGLELEYHLVDRRHPQRRVNHTELDALLAALPAMPRGSAVTSEPGGQLELSSPPQADIGAAISGLQADEAVLAAAVRAAGFGLASIGADPARELMRVTTAARYREMERHFDAVGCGDAGRQMMTATASLQVNVEAGPPESWADRLEHVHRLGPTLTAISACSPYLAGRASGWQSMRQQTWDGIDPARTRPVPASVDPAGAWAEYALAAPVMLIRSPASSDGAINGGAGGSDETAESVTQRVSFADWVTGDAKFYRRATIADLDYHLSTLFPPVRLRGYLEIRYLDAVPTRWWPALAAVVATLIDDPTAADEAADAVAGVEQARTRAARDGLRDPQLHRAARRCLDIAVRRCPPALRTDVERYAELIEQGRTPGDDVAEAARARGPHAALLEATDA